MRKHLLPRGGNFYKANLHVHTTVSDGAMTPEEIKKIYMEKGYSVVAFTDHEVMVPHPELTDENFLALTATEISVNDRLDCDFHHAKTYHLNIYSPEDSKSCFNTFDKSKMWLNHSLSFITPEQEKIGCERVYSVDAINDVIKKANDEGCLVSYNHPVWSLQNYSDYIGLKGLWGIEVYNTACARNGHFDSPKPMDDLLRVGERVMPLASDDAHLIQDCFGGYLMINADELIYDKIFYALKNGKFYSSVGPALYEISIENGNVRIRTSPASFVALCTDSRYLYTEKSADNSLTEVCFDINGYLGITGDGVNPHQYIRVMVIDGAGNTAFSRAYFIDELTT